MPVNCAVILAAGEGKRMKSQKAKVLQEVLFKPMLDWVIDAVHAAGIEQIYVVTGHNREQVEAHVQGRVTTVYQAQQLGTGHAVMQAAPMLERHRGANCLVLYGDAPLFSAATLQAAGAHHEENHLAATVITAFTTDPTGYGRIVRDGNGLIQAIVEDKDASEEQKRISEINGGAYWFSVDALLPALAALRSDNAQEEYYLTDVPYSMNFKGQKVGAYVAPFAETAGANDRYQLFKLNEAARKAILTNHMNAGVSIPCRDGVMIGPDVTIGQDTQILPGTILRGRCVIGRGCVIGPGSVLTDSTVGDECVVNQSQLTQTTLEAGVTVGPFAHLRPGTHALERVHIGDFVEVKNSTVGAGTKLPHLSYIGDSDVGAGVNCGCGTVTANYDGRRKFRTKIGDGCFVGCHTCLVAPVSLGEGAYTAAGSVVTDDVPGGALAVARSRQQVKPGWADERRALTEEKDGQKGK